MNTHFRYYPVTPSQRRWGIYVTCVGHNTTCPRAIFPSPEHPNEYYFTWEIGRTLHEWQLIILESGQGEVEFSNGRHKVRPGTLIVLPPNCWHRYRPDPKTGWTTYWIGFGGDLADRLFATDKSSSDGEIRSYKDNEPVLQLFAATVTDLLDNADRTPFSAAASIPMLVAAILESSVDAASNSREVSPILKAQTYIANHLSETIDFDDLAKTVGLSYRSFRYLFTKESGTSPLQYLLGRRLARAKNLLRSSDMPIMDIAESLGFSSTWYFTHFFQKHAHLSPAAYRKKHSPRS